MAELGHVYTFQYPEEFVTLPDYTAHAGHIVVTTRELTADDEVDVSEQPMWEIKASDGWVGHAFDDELV